MRRKLRLDVERLSVDSFDTAAAEEARRGTVHAAQEGEYPCTKWWSCDCPSAVYRCMYYEGTAYSCDYDTTGPAPSAGC